MGSLAKAIEPKSDQLNSDDLITGPITVKVTAVDINESAEQKVVIHYEGDNGKPYKPCKGMTRVMAEIWGGADNGKSFIGQSMTLYRDPRVKWAGVEVGGIRISHMTGINKDTPVVVTQAKGKRQPAIIHPLSVAPRTNAAEPDRALDWAHKLIAKIQELSTRQEANAALSIETVSTRLAQLSSSRPELVATIDAAVAALPDGAPGEPPAASVSVATLIKRLNAAKDIDAAGEVMTDPDVESLNAEDASKLMAAYRAKRGEEA